MKRLLILIFISFFVTGCFDDKSLLEEKNVYNHYIDELNSLDENDYHTTYPLDINVYFEKIIDEEVIYRVILDNPKVEMKQIEAIAIHDYKTNDIFPTTGIFDSKLNLLPNNVNQKLNNVKGIILVGYLPFDDNLDQLKVEVKVLVKYKDKNNKTQKIYYKYQK